MDYRVVDRDPAYTPSTTPTLSIATGTGVDDIDDDTQKTSTAPELTVGRFCTKNKKETRPKNSATLSVGVSDDYHPKVLLGLNMLDMGRRPLRLTAEVEDVTCDQFTVHLNTWGDSLLYNAGISWLKIPHDQGRTDFQYGSSTFDAANNGQTSPDGAFTSRIAFRSPFAQPPKVFTALSGFNIHAHDDRWKIKLQAHNIDCTGFDISLGPGGGHLHSGCVMWIAYSADLPNIVSGEFTGWPGDGWSGAVRFQRPFPRKPAVFAAFSGFSVDSGRNIRIKTLVEGVTRSGMNWMIKKWSDTKLYEVRVAYLMVA